MNKRLLGPGIIFSASLITFLFVFFRLPFLAYQELIAVFIGLIVILYSRFLKAYKKEFLKGVLLFLGTLSAQFLIISSGGLLSPFFILYHIFTLGLAFYNLQTSLAFLSLTLIDLSFFILNTPVLLQMVRSDPGTTLLYFASLMAIIPFSRLLASNYQLKVELANVLSSKVKLGETILENLDELIFVTDKDLNIISINGAVEKTLFISRSDIIGKSLFDYLFLKDRDSHLISEKSFSLEMIKTNEQSRRLGNLYLLTKNNFRPREVNLRIRPTISPDGLLEELTFIISDTYENPKVGDVSNLDQAWIRQMALIEDLKNRLLSREGNDLKLLTELIGKSSRDLNTAFELEEKIISIDPSLVDIAQISEKAIAASVSFADSLRVKLDFNLDNFSSEHINHLVPEGFKVSPNQLTSAYFTALVDIRWFDFCLQKLIDIAILLSSTVPDSKVSLTIVREDGNTLLVKIICYGVKSLSEDDLKELFLPYYGSLAVKTNLKLGSGLEGTLAKSLSRMMNLELEVKKEEASLDFSLRVYKQTRPFKDEKLQ